MIHTATATTLHGDTIDAILISTSFHKIHTTTTTTTLHGDKIDAILFSTSLRTSLGKIIMRMY